MTKPVIVTRLGKGSELTFQEGDNNFTNLRDATINVSGDSGTTQNIDLNGTIAVAGGTGLSTAMTSGTVTVNLDNTAVTAGSYTKANITVNAQGQITSAANGSVDIVDDTTPQLGGNLDAQGNEITNLGGITASVTNPNINLNPYLSSKVIVNGDLDASSIVSSSNGNISITPNGTGKVVLDGLSWPTADGTSNQVIKTDGSGNLSFTTITQYSDSAARSAISVTDAGGEGSISYNNSTGVITYTGPSFSGLEVTSAKNQANGYAGLDSNGKVASAQLPSYVDDVIEAANFAALPAEGETGKIYVALDNGKIYRWSGSAYVEISASPGSTDAVTEGSTNLYFTTQRARDAFSASTGITITNGAIATTITQYTDSLARAAFSAGTGITLTEGVIATTITQYADSNARSAISVTDAGGDGSLSYNNSTGVITYTGPSASEVRAHFSAGTGISITDGVIASTVTDTNTTYGISAETATGGVNLRLTGSDASSDNVKLAEGSNITITRTDADTITISGSAGGLTDIVQDTTPQLGGNLDVNGQSIVSVSNGNIVLAPNGTGRVILSGIQYPTVNGSNGQVLTTNGSGVASWATPSSGGNNIVILSASNEISLPSGANSLQTTVWTLRSSGGISGVSVSGSNGSFTLPSGTYMLDIPMLRQTAAGADIQIRNVSAGTGFAYLSNPASITISGSARSISAPRTLFFTLSATTTLCFANTGSTANTLTSRFDNEGGYGEGSPAAIVNQFVCLRIHKLS